MVSIPVRDYDQLSSLLEQAVARAEMTEKLFVYGIFLDQSNREEYGMIQTHYATQPGFKTVGKYIVKAVKSDDRDSLTGLLINNTKAINWRRLDSLEAGYKRIAIDEETYVDILTPDSGLMTADRVPIGVGDDLETIQSKVFAYIDSELPDQDIDIESFEVESEITYMYVDPSVDGKDYSTYVR